MNIVLIIIDTLRYDHVAAHGLREVHTPNLDALAAESWVFHNAYAASYPTIPHRTDVMTGRYGGPFHPWKPLDCDVPTLPGLLAEAGYCTQLIHDTPHLVNGGHSFDYPFNAWMPVRGAEVDRAWITDRWEYLPNWAHDPRFDGYPDDQETVLRHGGCLATYALTNAGREREEDWNVARLFTTAARFLRDNARRDNFFLWVDCFDPHEPWDVPPDFMLMYDPGSPTAGRLDPRCFLEDVRCDPELPGECAEYIRHTYEAKVSFADKWLGVFLDTLETTRLANRTAVLLTSDHGTNVGDRAGHRFSKSWPPLENEAHVPLMLRVPGEGSGQCDAICQPQDILHTLVGLGGGAGPESTSGIDLLALAHEPNRPGRSMAVTGASVDWWRRTGADGPLFSAFDGEWSLAVAARPDACRLCRAGTHEDVAAQHPEVVVRLRSAAVEEIERRGLDPALADWLRREGKGEFPFEFRVTDAHPAAPGWRQYWGNIYRGK